MSTENSESANSMTINISGRSIVVGCSVEDRENLERAAQLLNSEIEMLQEMAGTETIALETSAVMAALNFAAELLEKNEQEITSKKITELTNRIDSVMAN